VATPSASLLNHSPESRRHDKGAALHNAMTWINASELVQTTPNNSHEKMW